ncbi:unnamed protein product [Spirodela intermedia]|uniref:Uncharacterized protein n=1 Tax=Spirodela intermedia TaxID=51605 RepID=A0A7I8IKU8_SPIIN|nr:unnamed protein product [Spirodela intermedia]CAA6658363.1 unnamed protein product [Spirodela intermedia]
MSSASIAHATPLSLCSSLFLSLSLSLSPPFPAPKSVSFSSF